MYGMYTYDYKCKELKGTALTSTLALKEKVTRVKVASAPPRVTITLKILFNK